MRSGGASNGGLPQAKGTSKLVRRIVFHGDSDRTVHASNASVIVRAAMGEQALPAKITSRTVRGCRYARRDYVGATGDVLVELWMLEGGGHAWSGGRAAGSYTDSKGPDASAQMVRFFLGGSA
jgi:poly(3-hydroxybutyrate) depolymerase